MQLELINYFKTLETDLDAPVPEVFGEMNQTSLDFEVAKLLEYIVGMDSIGTGRVFLVDIPDRKIIQDLARNVDPNIRVSAILTVIDNRLPRLNLAKRL